MLRRAGWMLIAALVVGAIASWKVSIIISWSAAVPQRFPWGLV